MKKMMKPMIGTMDSWEERVVARSDTLKSLPNAPVRFEIMKESIKRGKAQMEPELATIMPGHYVGDADVDVVLA